MNKQNVSFLDNLPLLGSGGEIERGGCTGSAR